MAIDILALSKIIGAITVIVGVIFSVFKFIESSKKQTKEIKNIKQQQNCNGKVTEAINKIDKYINQAAHDENL